MRGIALVGLVDALLVLGAIVVVQQIEGHLLYPILMARTVHLHPAVIVVALAAGGCWAGSSACSSRCRPRVCCR